MSLTKVTYSMIKGAPVNVLDFGAIADGVTDNTAAIQAAIDALDSVDGGTLIFPQGIYGITDTVFIKDNIKLQGQGRPTIKAIDSIVGAMIQFGYTTGVVTDPPTNPCSNAELNRPGSF
jgi:polygalacturonase